jgi:hypothetical protein
MPFHLLLTTLDQEDGGQNQESAGDGREANVAEVVPQDDKERYDSKTEPPRQAAQPFAGTHGLISIKVTGQ